MRWRITDFITYGLLAIILAIDLIVPFVLGPAYPDYSNLNDTLSTLGSRTSPVAAVANSWLIAFGIVVGVLSVHEWQLAAHNWRAFAYGLALLGFALGAGVVAGLFPEDLPGASETVQGKVHGIGAGLGSLGLLIGLAFGAGMTRGIARVIAYVLVAIAWGVFAIFLSSKAPGSLAGLWQKAFLGSAYAAILVISAHIRSRA